MRRSKYIVKRVTEFNRLAYVASAQSYPMRQVQIDNELGAGIYLVMNLKNKVIKAYNYNGIEYARTEIPAGLDDAIAKWIKLVQPVVR